MMTEDTISRQKIPETEKVVKNFFRHEYANVISYLTAKFGPDYIEVAEDAVQDALLKAMKVWPYNEIPGNPTGWIIRVACNKIIDQLRRSKNFHEKEADIKEEIRYLQEGNLLNIIVNDDIISDDLLCLIFACCHPALSVENQITLTLKLLCGLSTGEIAKALLKKDPAVAKSITRAKTKLREAGIKLEVPPSQAISRRLETVLKIIYLLFNEGYSASIGDNLVKKDLCEEAIRLARLLLENKTSAQPEVHALLALMYFQGSRLEARTGEAGFLLTLDQQDRNLWDQDMITKGKAHLGKSVTGIKLSTYHIQAGIAYFHCSANDYKSTAWHQILALYNLLIKVDPSPVAALNRVVAYAKVNGATKALDELSKLNKVKFLLNYHIYYAIQAELLAEAGNTSGAYESLQKAIRLTENSIEKKYLQLKSTQLYM